MKHKIKASFTVEASLVVPLFLTVFSISITCLFYYHDKIVIGAAAYETVAVGSGRMYLKEEELTDYFYDRVEGRTIMFAFVDGEVEILEDEVEIDCEAKKGILSLKLKRSMSITEPEKYIRKIRKLEKVNEELQE